MPKKIKHILVIRLSAMGDVAMTVPILRALTHQYPQIKITVLTRPFFAPFFKNSPNVSVYSADLKEKHKGVFGLYKLSKELRNLGIDAVADLHNVLRSKILKLFLFGIKTVQIDKGRAEKKALVRGEKFQQLKTTHKRYMDVFEALGFKLDLSNPTFPEKSILNDRIKSILGDVSKKRIGVAPFAAHEGKMYPLDAMKDVIKALSKDYKVVLFGGGQKEIGILNEFETAFENVVNVAGKLSIDEELDVISNLDVMLSMDSGNAHMAAMLGVKVVSIWGVTHPFAGFAPFKQPEDYALLSDRNQFPKIPTSVYGNKYPENYKEASRSISPETIIEKIKMIL
ncbi:glycosyltransferase family 9 protein [Mariniflexile rhizosphaerae]|uniref:glycosyltransferase family 9 protein n=1 Tax=unclassified Mariniflexile TaxID=2643887 RepID=UPI000CB8F022|nr:glycosyltransferase family 9 protein [Mariniflexile sp. TRM1-10]PLB20111.1 MAG: ADP-heptose:LPS heptosyltransferase [Flavobacteriaceae bacterium FS1-H7996/R]